MGRYQQLLTNTVRGDYTEGDETEGDETEGDETEGDETEGDETEGDESGYEAGYEIGYVEVGVARGKPVYKKVRIPKVRAKKLPAPRAMQRKGGSVKPKAKPRIWTPDQGAPPWADKHDRVYSDAEAESGTQMPEVDIVMGRQTLDAAGSFSTSGSFVLDGVLATLTLNAAAILNFDVFQFTISGLPVGGFPYLNPENYSRDSTDRRLPPYEFRAGQPYSLTATIKAGATAATLYTASIRAMVLNGSLTMATRYRR